MPYPHIASLLSPTSSFPLQGYGLLSKRLFFQQVFKDKSTWVA